MQEYTESEAYRHLLTVTENIIDSLQTDPNIVQKYYTLKTALLAKVTPDPALPQLAHTRKLLNTYKYVTSSFIEVISQFETQIETTMQRPHYNRKVTAVVKEWELRLEDAKAATDLLTSKHKLIAKEEMSALRYYWAELDGKFQNLGLLIEVHKKMHEIIEQAARSESSRNHREDNLELGIQQLQREVGGVRQARAFVEQHKLTEKQHKEFKLWSGKLSSLLFA